MGISGTFLLSRNCPMLGSELERPPQAPPAGARTWPQHLGSQVIRCLHSDQRPSKDSCGRSSGNRHGKPSVHPHQLRLLPTGSPFTHHHPPLGKTVTTRSPSLPSVNAGNRTCCQGGRSDTGGQVSEGIMGDASL